MDRPPASSTPTRLETGVPGLDAVLSGGLLPGAMYLLAGRPGTGKTVLCCQVAFRRAALGERVLYVTAFSESNARLLANIESFAFFEPSLVVRNITFLSATKVLEEGGLEGLLAMLTREVRSGHASLLVVDTMGSVSEVAPSPLAYRRFLRELGSALGLSRCTALLQLPVPSGDEGIEAAIADGIIELQERVREMRDYRELRVVKSRGSTHLPGLHTFTIDQDGMTVYPRLEARAPARELAAPTPPGKQRLGVPNLDEMLGGGVPTGSVTAVLGPPGSGKTLLGLSFLAEGLREGQRCLYFGLYEMPPRLLTKAAGVGLVLEEHVRAGRLEVLWAQPTELLLDAAAQRILENVERRGVERVFIDGVDGLLMAAAHPERFPTFFAALSNALRARGVTMGISAESAFAGPHLGLAPVSLSASVENILFVRYVQRRAHLHRLLSIMKVRESGYDPSIREFFITARGLEVARTADSAEALLAELEGTQGGSSRRGTGLAATTPPPEGEEGSGP